MKNQLIAALVLLACFTGCASTNESSVGKSEQNTPMGNTQGDPHFLVTKPSADTAYGYTAENPIKVGVPDMGPKMERRFLDQLTGPKGEAIRYRRIGSCCHFPTPNGFQGVGLLDQYEVWIGDQDKPMILFLNMYDFDEPKIPVGFKSIH